VKVVSRGGSGISLYQTKSAGISVSPALRGSAALLDADRDHRIDLGRPARGEAAREQPDTQEQDLSAASESANMPKMLSRVAAMRWRKNESPSVSPAQGAMRRGAAASA
jgi:hypothetical protein